MRIALTHSRAAQAASPQQAGPPGLDGEVAGSYFPDTRVASVGEWISPLSFPNGAPRPHPLDVLKVPRGGESPWIYNAQSDEQGIGRSPGQQWPWQVIAEAYNFDSLAIMPFEWEHTGPVGSFPGGWDGRNPPERPPVFAYQVGGIPYYEQTEGVIVGFDSQVAVIEDPQQAAYTIGWGALDDPGGGGHDDGYGY